MPLFILILSVYAGDCQQGLKGTIYFHPKTRITLTGCFARVKNNTRNNFSPSFRCDRAASCKEAAGRGPGGWILLYLPTLFVLYNLALSITIEFKSTATLGILVSSQ
jgi:hypothetical protein